ncbi:MAG: metal dependent phosphohydrolase [Bacteroidetes bacterium]|nr:metal dependent phosphohydrolase [Bacteroidota bacterium]
MPNENQKVSIKDFLHRIRPTSASALRVVIASSLVVLLALMFPRGEDIDVDYKVGAVWAQKDVIAPFSFALLRDERDYKKDVDQAKQSVYPVLEHKATEEKHQSETLKGFFNQLDSGLAARAALKRGQKDSRSILSNDSTSAFVKASRRMEIPLTDDEWETCEALKSSGGLGKVKDSLAKAFREFHAVGVLDRPKANLSRHDIALRRGTQEEIVPAARLYDRNDVQELLDRYLTTIYKNDPKVRSLAYKIGITLFEPNLRFSETATRQAEVAAISAIPRTSGYVQENERIVSKHERITPETKLKLESLARARADRGTRRDYTIQRLGIGLHVVMIVMLYGIYLYLFRKRIFWNNRLLALIALLIVLEGFFAYLTRELDVNAPIEYLIFVPAASMLLTIIFDSRVGFYGTVIIALLVAGIRGNDYAIALTSIIGGALSVYTVRDMRNRSQIFRSLGFIFLGYALSIIALGVERFESVGVVTEQIGFALANAIVSPVLTYGLLIFFERVFRVTTDLTLMELTHFNHPLLRKLSEQAPGTYHHSLTIATLAEAAASAIGANEVLARVGALFHDIGKLVKPMYFAENQKGSRNRHDKLTPRMSSLIISAHVKEGMNLGEEQGLPREVIDFIPMHHGTTRIEFFYNKALELANQSDDETKLEEINDQDYRYPGPKPQTRETGILMLADAVEASTRSLDDPSPQKLEAVIDEIIRQRFGEGELDECPLTLKDLTKIKGAFLNSLVGMHHTRVKYTTQARKRVPRPKRVEELSITAPQEPQEPAVQPDGEAKAPQ